MNFLRKYYYGDIPEDKAGGANATIGKTPDATLKLVWMLDSH